MSRSPSFRDSLHSVDRDGEEDDISLQDLQPSQSTNSRTGLIPHASQQDGAGGQSTVYKGVRQLFLGGSKPDHRKSADETLGLDKPPIARSSSVPPGEESSALDSDLLNPDSLNVIKAGLNEALGSDGKGSWLSADDDNDNASTSDVASQKSSRKSEMLSVAPPSSPLHAINSAYRKSSDKLDTVNLVEEGPDEHDESPGNHQQQPPPSPSSASKHLSTMFQNFSSRVVSPGRSTSPHKRQSEQDQSRLSMQHQGPSIESLHEGYDIDPAHHSVFVVDQTDPDEEEAGEHPPNADDSKPILCGNSLMMFPVNSKFRQACHRALQNPFVGPFILILIFVHTVILSYINAPNVFKQDEIFYPWGKRWTDYVLLLIFIVYTAETAAKIIAFGLWDDSQLINPDQQPSFRDIKKIFRPSNSQHHNTKERVGSRKEAPVVMRTLTSLVSKQSDPTYIERAYLRSSWNRVDFVSVISFWISFLLNVSGVENSQKLFLFRMMSSIRILRLLNLTKGTSSVLRALKKAAPLLANIAIFIGFFWMLFSIVGVQSFKSSLRRTCVWVDPEGIQDNYTTGQFCGSYLNPVTLDHEPYVFKDGSKGPQAKGYTCPVNSVCVSNDNPYGGTVSFDNVFNSLEMVFVIMTANTFTDIMYDITDSDYLAAALFFMAGIVVLYIWLMNLLIAVIASSFNLVREESPSKGYSFIKKLFANFGPEHLKYLQRTKPGRLYHKFRVIPTIVIFVDIVVQCTLTAKEDSSSQRDFIYRWQIFTTVVLTLEILVRFVLYLPYWRVFFRSKSNIIDTVLAIITIVMITPLVHNNEELYAWMSIFQLARFYRIAITVPFIRDFWSKVLGNYKTIFNLTTFFFLLCYLCSLLAATLLRGIVPYEDDDGEVSDVSFFDLSNTFIGLYQISSTEDWTGMVYSATENAPSLFVAITFGIFFVMWYIFSNFIVLNLFIAVITENLEMPQEVKRKAQIKSFVKEYAAKLNHAYHMHNTTGGLKVLKSLIKRPKEDPKSGTEVFDMLLERHVVEEFLDENDTEVKDEESLDDTFFSRAARQLKRRLFIRKKDHQANPFLDEHELVDQSSAHPTNLAKDFLKAQSERTKLQQQYLERNPKYDTAMYIFSPSNKLRRICQSLVAPSYGTRNAASVTPKQYVWYAVWSVMLMFTIGLVCVACINTPLYTRHATTFDTSSWITIADLFFLAAFSMEMLIKVIADGFWFTPNAYFKSSWNKIDFLVLVSLWINIISEAFYGGYVSRFVRCFQALRALRLLSISTNAQQTFHSVIIVGIGKIAVAAMLSMCLLFPYSVWGLNIFNGKLSHCNDDDVNHFSECVDEYSSSPYNWDVLAPRVVTKDYFDYDTFGHALLIQFGVISLEGWIDVLNAVMAITGRDTNPEPNYSRHNGVYPILYNFLSTIFILSMFVAVIIRNYSETRGTAYLTDEQLAWYEVEKILKLVKPSRRPPIRKPGSIREYLLKKTQAKNSWIAHAETGLLAILVLLLCVEYYPAPDSTDTIRNALMLFVIFLYEVLSVAKLYALGFRLFIKRKWELHGLVIGLLAFIFTLIGLIVQWDDFFYNFQKSFIVGMLLLWIPKSQRLDQLFKTASASFLKLGNLLVTWFVLFLAYAIAFNQVFGLTRIGPHGSNNLNFRTVPKAMIFLFRSSFGEGWNEVLNDYLIDPPYCVEGDEFDDTDCGSHAYAYILFISWNIISMYIFVNMFISLIYENFSYVFHRSSSEITKEDIHLFKQSWLQFDPYGSGYIPTKDLHKFLRVTEGYFGMSIYSGKDSVKRLLADAKIELDPNDPYHVDMDALNSVLKSVPSGYYKHRRWIYDMFCTQALLEAHPVKGIAFNNLLRQVPFYKGMEANRCLK